MKKLLFIITIITITLFSCAEVEEQVYEGESISYFTNGTSGKYYVQDDPNTNFEIEVGVTHTSDTDRTFTVNVVVDETTAQPEEYSLSNFVIPAGSNIGYVDVKGNYDSIVSGDKLVIELTNVDNSKVAEFDNKFEITFYQFCPLNISDFYGDWLADEEGYAVYNVTISPGPGENEIIISNVWDVDPTSTTSVFLDDSDASNFVLVFPSWEDNYLYDNSTYGPAYIDQGYGTFSACTLEIDMRFKVRVDAGTFSETHISFTKI